MSEEIEIFKYTNYRDYLRDWLVHIRKSRPLFSLRAFSKKAGFGAPNFYTLIMDGKRNLTAKSIIPFMKGLGLNKVEREYFFPLVFYTQAKKIEDKKKYFDQMLSCRKFRQIKYTDRDYYEFYANWYSPVIRELVTHPEFKGNMNWLSDRLGIGLGKIKKSLKIMLKLGLIEKSENGTWKTSQTLLSTGDEVKTYSFLEYHNQILDLAKDKMLTVSQDDRDMSALTLGVSKNKLPEIKKRIQEFRKDILKLVSSEEIAEEVVILGMQLFPVTREGMNEI